jgi:hypothetical protein
MLAMLVILDRVPIKVHIEKRMVIERGKLLLAFLVSETG